MTDHLRIGQVSDWFLPKFGGIEMQVARLSVELQRFGHEVEIITGTPGPSEHHAVKVHRLKVWQDPWLTVTWSPWQTERLKDVFRQQSYDVIHVHASFPSPLASSAALAARSLGIPCVVTFHSVLLKSVKYLRLANRLYDWYRGQKLTVVSQTLAHQVEAAYPPHKPQILNNGIDFAFWSSGQKTPRENDDELRLVSTMRLNWKKRPLKLIRCVHAAQQICLAQGKRRVSLRIAGEGSKRQAMASLIKSLGCEDTIELLGVLDHMKLKDLYRSSDVFVISSIEEAFGIAALEARCAGLPVITMAASGSKEFLTQGVNAILADTDQDFTQAIVDLSFDEAKRLALAGDDLALARFGWPRIVEDHVAIYRQALTANSA